MTERLGAWSDGSYRPEPEASQGPHRAVNQPDGGLAPAPPGYQPDDITFSGHPIGGEPGQTPAPTPAQRVLRSLIEWLLVAVVALGLALLLQIFLVQAFSIPSRSMEPTLAVGDRVIVFKLGYRLHDINRGDVVVFSNPDQTGEEDDLIKRVIAVGGETFEMRDGHVHIDGLRLEEPYLQAAGSSFAKQPIPGCTNPAEPGRCEVPEGHILVLGDNRQFSRDGRYFGPVDVDTVVGRAFMKYWPPGDIGGV